MKTEAFLRFRIEILSEMHDERVEECFELLDEVKALDEELGIVRRSYEHLLGECARLKGENALLFNSKLEYERFIAQVRFRQWVQPW